MQPERILHYDITEHLGEGPHGESYRARDRRQDREVVLKLIIRSVFSQDATIEAFKTSITRLKTITHPHLAVLYAVEETDDAIVVTHEYVEGASMGELLQRGPFLYEAFLDHAIQITEGLHALHAEGLIHGHISTDNVMIDHEGNIKLVDFGLPALGPAYVEDESSEMQRTAVFSADQTIVPPDADADFFALGGLFYEMLTGRAPFSDEGENSTAGLAVLPPEVQLLVEKLLTTDKSEQFSGMDELLVTLREMKQFVEHPPEIEGEKHFSPRFYLTISILAFLLIILWWVVTTFRH
jgi:eukaryotic-like serine/threonine-protein kinase